MAEIIMIGCEKTVEEMQRVMDEINQFYELVADVYNIDLNEEKRRASIVKSDLMKVVRKAESRENIYAVVKRYAVDGDESTFDDWIYKPSNHDGIYDKILDWCKSYMAEFAANNEFDPYAAIMGTESKNQKLYCECVEYVSDIGKYLAERSEEFNKRRKEIVYGK